jgi:hypothetical protein
MLVPFSRRPSRPLCTFTLGALLLGACQAGPSTASVAPTGPPPAATTSPPDASPAPTTAPAALGTITLTEGGCSWPDNPGSIAPGPVLIQSWNETDDFADFFAHRLRDGKTWDDGLAAIAAIQAAIKTGDDWPPAVSDVVGEGAALAGLGDEITFDAAPGTYGVVCSANTSPTGDVLSVYLVGPLVVGQ